MSAWKSELHELVEALPESEAHAARRFLKFLAAHVGDPVLEALRRAPIDDEPETDAERAAVAEARAQIARGETLTTEQLRDELGL
jgi:hypothetical protein